MKIGNTADKPSLAPVVQPASAAASEPAKVAASGSAIDPSAKVELSSTAETLLTREGTAEFDNAKVDRISKAIAEGSFTVNAELIADKLIANAQELLGKVQR